MNTAIRWDFLDTWTHFHDGEKLASIAKVPLETCVIMCIVSSRLSVGAETAEDGEREDGAAEQSLHLS